LDLSSKPVDSDSLEHYGHSMRCPQCGTDNEDGRKFCGECGSALARLCPTCQTPNPPTSKFCGECGAPLAVGDVSTVASPGGPGRQVGPTAERRLVSILFADLVGFTTLSETRDAEEVRDLLGRYFDLARRIIGRYGGVVEKFIGDAVMAVWGTPVAQEDDAERAVRAALDLTGAISALGEELDARDLNLRASVLTGEAAVTIGAEGQGMVAGDLVNTASRMQSLAQPGTVLVGDATRRATEAAISYEDAGELQVKGRADPVRAWRALHVVAARGGVQRHMGLEPPFVGREREMRSLKELFHASGENGNAHLVSVVGIAGIGKTRVSWEFEKYLDGLAGEVWWHRGRCLAYGEGVTYWALAEMVRSRAGIVEDEDFASARAKLHAELERQVPDQQERGWIEPQLGQLLGFQEGTAADRDGLFSAWRLFFERMAETGPVAMVFEDLHWADEGLLDFLDHLLEWSREHPIFILTLARPELADRRPNWGVARRNLTSLFLEPLSNREMDLILQGMVPGLPAAVLDRIKQRAEGVPLYAVETVRMLLDREAIRAENGQYTVVDEALDLEIPESLQALIAARLDGVSAEEKRTLQDAAVLGKTFTKQSLAAMTGTPETDLDSLLSGLVRKDLLVVQADPRSPERGQYGFLQALVQKVAYDMLSRRERKAKHLRAADFLFETWGSQIDEIAEVVAAHYLDAYRAYPDDDDAAEIRTKARDTLVAAGERAASLAAGADALRYYRDAAELADDPMLQADLFARVGNMAMATDDLEEARNWYERAIALFEANGQTHKAASVSARLAVALWETGEIEVGLEGMERAFAVLSQDDPDKDVATLAAQIGRFHTFMGNREKAAERIEFAIDVAERLWFPDVISEALNTKSIILIKRPQESLALQERSLQIALDNDAHAAALRAYYNLGDRAMWDDLWDRALDMAREGNALSRRVGDIYYHLFFQSMMLSALFLKGEWDEMQRVLDEMPSARDLRGGAFQDYMVWAPMLHCARGRSADAHEVLAEVERMAGSADVQEQGYYNLARAVANRLDGDLVAAYESATAARAFREHFGPGAPAYKLGMIEAMEVAMELGDLDSVQTLIDEVEELPPGFASAYLRAHALRMRARLASMREDPREAETLFSRSIAMFEEVGSPFPRSITALEFGEWMSAIGDEDRARSLLDEAQAVFESLGAAPWLERIQTVGSLTR
jgi:class 3 adenylate cyclase/tetratricopeptide (TPR) repeat protein